jgi:hypothetical protein
MLSVEAKDDSADDDKEICVMEIPVMMLDKKDGRVWKIRDRGSGSMKKRNGCHSGGGKRNEKYKVRIEMDIRDLVKLLCFVWTNTRFQHSPVRFPSCSPPISK